MVLGVLLLKANGPRWIAWLLLAAGAAYIVDTIAHLVLADYEASADLLLAIVAVTSIVGEMSFAVWLLLVEPVAARPPPPRHRNHQPRRPSPRPPRAEAWHATVEKL